jgi:16S rRNA (cytosine967-C5)-methyltransferase
MRVVQERVALEDVLSHAAPLDRRDAPLLRALVFGTLRWHHRLQWQLSQLLTRPLRREHAALAALARVGLYQLQELRIPDHAAVSATVDAAAALGHGQAKGLINAVLRRYQRERSKLDRRMADDAEALFAHPRWLIEQISHDWPRDWRRILEQNNVAPPMWLRINARRTTREGYAAELAAAGLRAASSDRAASALLLAEPLPVDALPGFAAGLVSVQDAAAQLAAGLLDPRPGQRVLDACAAPGGKTAHILESCPELGDLWALDRDATRLEKVAQNLDRLGLRARLLAGDATLPEQWWDGRPFERILLDAPCSATGVIRRHPDIKVLRRAHDVQRAVALQARLLAALWPLLEPGGRLLYATCSVLSEENRAQVERFLGVTPDAALVGPGPGGHLQILPGSVAEAAAGEANMDGFYYACLEKRGVLRSPRVSRRQHDSVAQRTEFS